MIKVHDIEYKYYTPIDLDKYYARELKVKYNVRNRKEHQVRQSHEVADYFRVLYRVKGINIEHTENVFVMLLSTQNNVIGWEHISMGATSGTVVPLEKITAAAYNTQAARVVLCHNHPSGNKRPSNSDKVITKQLLSALRFSNIFLIDSIILTYDSYFSFADEGLIDTYDAQARQYMKAIES